jgi:thermitase
MKKLSFVGALSLAVFTTAAVAKMGPALSPHVPGEALVKVKPGLTGRFLAKKSLLGAEVKDELRLVAGNYFLLKSTAKSTASLVSQLEALPEVIFAEPNYIYKTEALTATGAPADPLYEKLWGLRNTGANEPDRSGGTSTTPGVAGADVAAEKAWAITRGSNKIVVAIIDTGIDYRHPDLEKNLWVNMMEIPGNQVDDDQNGYVDDVYGWNAEGNHGDPMDGNAHGTHCAGTIGAEHNNGQGVAGVMADVALMGVKFLSDTGSGTLADAVEAIDYATRMNVDVMSNSWGGGGFSQALFDAITAAKDKGIVFVAAAGNDSNNNDNRASYPASYQIDNVISVASHTAQDVLSSFSNFGRRTVHVAAPGTNILSTVPNGQYKVFSGTSMATPHVSGLVGLLLAETGRLPVLELRERLMATTVPGAGYRQTTAAQGRVNAYNFVTDTRIPRPGPEESAWRTETLVEAFETAHPYADNTRLSKTYHFPGAKYVKLVIERYEIENGYDFLTIKDGKGATIERLTGAGQRYETDYTDTDTVTVEFASDSTQTRWGVLIREVKVVY